MKKHVEKKNYYRPPPRTEIKTQLNGQLADIPIVHSLYQLYLSWHQMLIKFPKTERYSLGASCEQQLLAAIEAIVAAAAISNKETKLSLLRKASAKLDLLRLLIRLSKDCECLSNQAYLQLESQLHEIGKMLGGWIKSLS